MPKLRWVAALLLVAAVVPWQSEVAEAEPNICATRPNNTPRRITDCVTVEGVREHQAAFQAIADANGGNRFSGLPGYDASVDYVVETLEAAGYEPTVQQFDYLAFAVDGPSALEQTAPDADDLRRGRRLRLIDQTDGGDVTAPVTAVDLQLGPGNTSTSGCEAADFAGFPAGNIALHPARHLHVRAQGRERRGRRRRGRRRHLQPGQQRRTVTDIPPVTLDRRQHQRHPGRSAPPTPLGVELGRHAGPRDAGVRRLPREIKTDLQRARRDGRRRRRQRRDGRRPPRLGVEGPGINDNGSGSAAHPRGRRADAPRSSPTNKVRFAWWGAEESGLRRLRALRRQPDRRTSWTTSPCTSTSTWSARRTTSASSTTATARPSASAGPQGSAAIEDLFEHVLRRPRAWRSSPPQFSGRSRLPAVHRRRHPGRWPVHRRRGHQDAPSRRRIYGGTAGQPYDPCYHQACDTFDNVTSSVLDVNSDAIGFAVVKYSKSTETVNGVRRGNVGGRAAPAVADLAAMSEAG